MGRLVRRAGRRARPQQPLLEGIAENALVKRLESRAQLYDVAGVLFDQALLAEGGQLEDPAAYVKRVNSLLLA